MKSSREFPIIRVVSHEWRKIALAGFSGGLVLGAIIQFGMGKMSGIGVLYGSRSLVLGWIMHVFHSIVGAFIFAGLARNLFDSGSETDPLYSVMLGLAYSIVLWVMTLAILLPIWSGVMSPWGRNLPPNFTNVHFVLSYIGFLLYGLIISAPFMDRSGWMMELPVFR